MTGALQGTAPSDGDGHFSRARVAANLQQPTRPSITAGQAATVTPKAPIRGLHGLARGGVCRAPSVTTRAVGSYPTLAPLPDPTFRRAIGGLLSVALSLARDRWFERVGITHHRVLPCSDFPPGTPKWGCPATVLPQRMTIDRIGVGPRLGVAWCRDDSGRRITPDHHAVAAARDGGVRSPARCDRTLSLHPGRLPVERPERRGRPWRGTL